MHRHWTRTNIWIAVTLLVLVATLARAQDRIRLGLSSISATSGSIWVAEEKGLFKKHGVNVEVIFIGGGASRVVSALLAGEIQFSVGGGDAVIRAALRGADTVLAASPMTRGLQRVITRPDIKTPDERETGVLECWSTEVMGPVPTQYSITPTLHHSNLQPRSFHA